MLVIAFKRWLVILLLACFIVPGVSTNVHAQDDLDFQELLSPVDSTGIFETPGYYTWCSSVIKGEDGKYHMFYSRWPHGVRPLDDDSMNYIFNGFRGWCKYSEIAYAVSEKLNGPYRFVKIILKGTGEEGRWDRFTMYNPQVRKFNGRYYLYYISNSFDTTLTFKSEAKMSRDWKHWLKYNCTQKIGVISAGSIEDLVNDRFTKPAGPLMQPDNVNTFEVTTNPTVCKGPDGKYYMMYKSRKPEVGNMTFWMAKSDHPDGPFTQVGEVFTSAEMACEDPCIWFDNQRRRFYAAVKYYSHSGAIVKQFGALALITSVDGLHWEKARHPLISLRELQMANGLNIKLAYLERPFIVTGSGGQPLALFAAAAIKEPGDLNNTFNVCIPIRKK
jgi:hypothetical protein